MKIILPHSLAIDNNPIALETLNQLRLPALARLLHGKVKTIRTPHFWEMIATNQFEWPGLAPTLLAQDLPSAPAGFWLRADPVLLSPCLDNLMLLSANQLNITRSETEALVASLNQFFAGDKLTFYAAHPNRWYVHCPQKPAVYFTDLSMAMNQPIDHLLPTGPEAIKWHRYLNELQMLFYTHPVNESRAQKKQALISSVWFWGGGYYPFQRIAQRGVRIYSNQSAICDQAQALGYRAQLFSSNIMHDGDEQAVWIIGGLEPINDLAHIDQWAMILTNIDQEYLEVASKMLRCGKITKIELLIPNPKSTHSIVTSRTDLWKIWRLLRPYSLQSLLK